MVGGGGKWKEAEWFVLMAPLMHYINENMGFDANLVPIILISSTPQAWALKPGLRDVFLGVYWF